VKRIFAFGAAVLFLSLGCNLVEVIPSQPTPITEIPPGSDPAPAEEAAEAPPPTATPVPEPTATPTLTPTPAPPTPTPYFLKALSLCPGQAATDINNNCCPYAYEQDPNGYCAYKPGLVLAPDERPATPRHGLLIAFVLPLLIIGIPWTIAELYVVRYVQPRGIDLSTIRIKAQDGLFLDTTISLTARRKLTLASTRMTWPRVRAFVEKPLEQELIHDALQYSTLEELELGLKDISEQFRSLPIVKELSDDFGVEVMRFNIEASYSQETMDAINRKAEASAGGTAYLAYAAAAHLNPESPEARQLYTVYQETTGRVDAARNLGGGLTSLAEVFTIGPERKPIRRIEDVDDDDADD